MIVNFYVCLIWRFVQIICFLLLWNRNKSTEVRPSGKIGSGTTEVLHIRRTIFFFLQFFTLKLINYQLSQKFKQLGNGKFNCLTIIFTLSLTYEPYSLLIIGVQHKIFLNFQMSGRVETGFELKTMMNYWLSQKLKLLGHCEFSRLINILPDTIFWFQKWCRSNTIDERV